MLQTQILLKLLAKCFRTERLAFALVDLKVLTFLAKNLTCFLALSVKNNYDFKIYKSEERKYKHAVGKILKLYENVTYDNFVIFGNLKLKIILRNWKTSKA